MKRFIFILFVILCVLVSCDDMSQLAKELRQKSVTLKVDDLSTGKSGEVLLVMNKEWPDNIQDSIYAILRRTQMGLPQPEPMFTLYQVNPDMFKGDFTRQTNIVHIDVNSSYEGSECKIEKNTWSRPQTYVHICAPTQQDAVKCLAENSDKVLKTMFDTDIAKLQALNAQRPNADLIEYVHQKFGIMMTIPEDYEIGREGDDFLWLLYRTPVNDRFVMIYTTPNKKLTREAMMIKRNFITHQYIEGATPDIYPEVTEVAGYPIHQPLTIGAKEGAELRGLWDTKNDYMGGPFYQFSFINLDGECVTIDGSVYAPKENKAVYMRQVEAIVKSVK